LKREGEGNKRGRGVRVGLGLEMGGKERFIGTGKWEDLGKY